MKAKMSTPKITLITGCYNHEKYIGETIESVVSQGYPNLEYIVINDGSTDNSEKIIKSYAKHLTHWETWGGHRKTIVPALNKGFAMSTGPIMGWLNSKNTLLPKSLFTIAEIFTQLEEVDWFTGIATTIDEDGKPINVRNYKINKYDYLTNHWKVIQQESTFWRRSLWEKSGGALKEQWAFDVELWTRFFQHAPHYHVTTTLGTYRKTKNANSIKFHDQFCRLTEEALKNMYDHASPHEKKDARLYQFSKKILRPLLARIPNHTYASLPVFKKFCHDTITFSSKDHAWKTVKENPFKEY